MTIALCCAALGDRTSASLELDTAREAFTRLGAHPDLARVESLAAGVKDRASNPLSPREREILVQVASGKTNREVVAALVISEHTVGRHLENVFAKLGVTSRAAAVAHAMIDVPRPPRDRPAPTSNGTSPMPPPCPSPTPHTTSCSARWVSCSWRTASPRSPRCAAC